MDEKDTQIAELTEKLSNASSELADMRSLKTSTEAEKDALAVKVKELETQLEDAKGQNPDVESIVAKVLSKKDQESSEKNRKTAEQKFKSQYKEFEESNDPSGLKFQDVLKKVSGFKTEGLSSEEDFINLLEEAYLLVNPNRVKQRPVNRTGMFASTVQNPGSGPREVDADDLSSAEKSLIERLGWTKEKYLDQVKKRPSYVSQLLKHLN